MRAKSGVYVSVVVPLRNDAAVLPGFVRETLAVLAEHYVHYELLLIDDWSTDDTVSVTERLLKDCAATRLIRLSRRCGDDIAATAGLEAAIGDIVVLMQADVDPPSEIPKLVEFTRQSSGVDVVLGCPENRVGEGPLYRTARGLFHLVAARGLGLALPREATTLQALTRRAVNAVTRVKQKRRYLPLLCCGIGYGQAVYSYRQEPRTGRPRRRSLREAVDLGLASLVTTSTSPLRFVSYAGCAAGLLNLLYVAYVFGVNVMKSHVAEGWTTLSLQASTMFFMVFAILVVMSEYISRILDEAADRPLYHVMDEVGSAVATPGENVRNVLEHSVLSTGQEERRAA